MIDLVVKALSALAIALFSAWITVHLSRNKFRSERWWEKKVEAYERVLDAFHKAKKYVYEHTRAMELELEFDEVRVAELKQADKEARDEILRSTDLGGFILSPKALDILTRYKNATENMARQESWYDYLDLTWSLTDSHMKEFVAEAQADLKRKSD